MSANKTWTTERLMAVRKLAELSTVYRPNGVPHNRKDWDAGLSKLQSQDHKSYKIVKNIPIQQIKWAWSKYQNVTYGFCATTMCPNKVTNGEFYCPSCKPVGSAYHRGIYSSTCVEQHKELVKKAISSYKEKDLQRIVAEGITKMSFSLRKEILGDTFKSLVEAKETKKG